MASPVRVGTTRAGRSFAFRGGQPSPDALSSYGPTRADSIGYNPANPHQYSGTQVAKAYKTSKGTRDWDGPQGISPPVRPATAETGD